MSLLTFNSANRSDLSGQNQSSSSGSNQNNNSSSSQRPDSTESSQTQSSSNNNNQNSVTNSLQQLSSGTLQGNTAGSGSGGAGSGKKWSGVQLTADGHLANIPPGMLTDQYGMAGLVALLANTENNQSLFSLAIGYDISSINLNLNSKE